MAKPKVSLPQGTRDFGPEVLRKRQYIVETIRQYFELHGFQPLETPAIENLDTLMGKYGEEGDKLIFKILNNGLDRPEKQDQARRDFEEVLKGKNNAGITERALRYDLTIPFARYVAMNQGQLGFPFKRYQIQPVWRADRPQKGRYREFYQCDADVVGSTSLLNEVDLTLLYQSVFEALRLPVEIRINSRKILAALAESCGRAEGLSEISAAIDKLDKIGIDKVKEELAGRGLKPDQVNLVEKYLQLAGPNAEKMKQLEAILPSAAAGGGLDELRFILQHLEAEGRAGNVVVDFTLARGLNYYTGIIFEVKALDFAIGSIGGGGRYDDLTGLFGVSGIPGVGISFGLDRIYDVLEGLSLFPDSVGMNTRVLFVNMGDAESKVALQLLGKLRRRGISAELYPDAAKMDKQFKFAAKKGIPYTVIIGSQELEQGECVVKNLEQGRQDTVRWEKLEDFGF